MSVESPAERTYNCSIGMHTYCDAKELCGCACHLRKHKTCSDCGAALIGNEARGHRCNRCLESPPKFVAVRLAVMRGSEWIANAGSHNMARRIARALNAYKPNERGY